MKVKLNKINLSELQEGDLIIIPSKAQKKRLSPCLSARTFQHKGVSLRSSEMQRFVRYLHYDNVTTKVLQVRNFTLQAPANPCHLVNSPRLTEAAPNINAICLNHAITSGKRAAIDYMLTEAKGLTNEALFSNLDNDLSKTLDTNSLIPYAVPHKNGWGYDPTQDHAIVVNGRIQPSFISHACSYAERAFDFERRYEWTVWLPGHVVGLMLDRGAFIVRPSQSSVSLFMQDVASHYSIQLSNQFQERLAAITKLRKQLLEAEKLLKANRKIWIKALKQPKSTPPSLEKLIAEELGNETEKII